MEGKRVDKKRMMDVLSEEIDVQMYLMERLVKSWLKWSGHLVWMGEERMPKIANRLRSQGRKKRGRLWMRWEDCGSEEGG